MLRLLATPRWLGYFAFTLVFAIACCALGIWQWNRREEALDAIARLDANWGDAATPLAQVLPEFHAYEASQQWTTVELRGSYDSDDALLLRGRTLNGEQGFQQIVPFVTDDQSVFYVDRGWIPGGDDAANPAWIPEIPAGELLVTARLRENEGDIPGRDAPEGQIISVNLATLAATQDLPTYTGAYGLLATENGGTPSDTRVVTKPELDEGPHLSYCLQWFVFAIMGFIGFGWALRQEARNERGEVRVKKLRRDDDEEDALLDDANAER